MAYREGRILMYDRGLNALGDLSARDVVSRPMVEEVNGEHSLTIKTSRVLEVGTRLLSHDLGKWREFVVTEPDEVHESGMSAVGTYRAVWSLQNDLTATDGGTLWAAAEEGTNDPIPAAEALSIALTNSPIWRPGRCDVTTMAGASFFDKSCWDYLSQLVERWGGEIDAEIDVSATGVVSRRVSLLSALGSGSAVRRFEWSRGLTSIRRTPDPGPYFCRVRPRGGSEGTDADGVAYSDRVGIESENGGRSYLQDDEAALAFRMGDGKGGWVYPTKTVVYDLKTKGDAEELMQKAVPDLHAHTRPGVTYDATVSEFAAAGMDAAGISLGDAVQCVDRGFSDGSALRIDGRVMRLELDGKTGACKLVIGKVRATIGSKLGTLTTTVTTLGVQVDAAKAAARDASQKADSVREHFWHDDEGAHVTQETEDAWAAEYELPGHGSIGSPTAGRPWYNTLVSSAGMFLRSGIRSLVSMTRDAISFLDGDEETATFGPDSARIGKPSSRHVDVTASGFEVFGADGSQSVAFLGDRARIGPEEGLHEVVGDGGFGVYYGDDRLVDVKSSGLTTNVYLGGTTLVSHDYTDAEVESMATFLAGCTVSQEGPPYAVIGQDGEPTGQTVEMDDGITWRVLDPLGRPYESVSYECISYDFELGEFAANQKLVPMSEVEMPVLMGLGGVRVGFSDGLLTVTSGDFTLDSSGDAWFAGSVSQSSDRRLKEHVSWLGQDACEFVGRLKPALFRKGGRLCLGFYAQDVAEADEWGTGVVSSHQGGKVLSLDYTALIAPLVAYCQSLGARIESLETTNERTEHIA